METQKINNDPKKKKSGNHATMAATASAAVGVAIGAAGAELINDQTEPVAEVDETEVVEIQEEDELPTDQDAPTDVETEIIEPEQHQSEDEPQPIVTEHPEVANNTQHQKIETPQDVAPIDDDDIVNIITQVVEIDPDDIDSDPLLTITDIGTIYTVDGESLLAATVQGSDGSELLIVDIDDDGVFDVAITYEGEIIGEIGGDIDVSDVEHHLSTQAGDYGYLAANEFDQNLDYGSEIQQNIIETT